MSTFLQIPPCKDTITYCFVILIKILLCKMCPWLTRRIILFDSLREKLPESNKLIHPASIYLFKVNNKNTRKKYEICSKLTIKTPERQRRSGVFIVNFEHISQFSHYLHWSYIVKLPSIVEFEKIICSLHRRI